MVAAVRKMKRKKNEIATKNSNINSKMIRSPDVKYVSAYFNTVGGKNVIVVPKRNLNENKVETSTDVKYVSGYFDYSRISSEDVIVIPPKKKKKNENEIDGGGENVIVVPKRKLNENKVETSTDVKYVSGYFDYSRINSEDVIPPKKKKNENEIDGGGKNVIVVSKRKLNENKVETSTNVKYVSGYFDYSRISSEDVIVIPPKKKKNEIETVGSVSPNVGMCKYCNVKPLKSPKPELRSDAYKRKTPNNTWKPPKSTTFGHKALLQEGYVYDPWRVIIVSMLLNVTSGKQVCQVLSNLFRLCPDAKSCTQVAVEEIEEVIRSLGLQDKRPKMLKHLSQQYLYGGWTHVTQLHGVGKYVGDAYAIFCTGEWRNVTPNDKELLPYWNLLWSLEH